MRFRPWLSQQLLADVCLVHGYTGIAVTPHSFGRWFLRASRGLFRDRRPAHFVLVLLR
jgi:hypothetical protein